MKLEQKLYQFDKWGLPETQAGFVGLASQLVIVFGKKELLTEPNLKEIRKSYANAQIVVSSTAGEVYNDSVLDDTICVTAVQFDATPIACLDANISAHQNSFDLGADLMKKLSKDNLCYVLVLSDGSLINGTELVDGIQSENSTNVLITGGLAGDGPNFQSTITGLNDNIGNGNVVLVAFYGDKLRVGHGSLGGWDEFGHERTITKSDKNTLFELDNKSALQLYKDYLGPYSEELPGSALLFPLSLRINETSSVNVRTILSLDEENNSMTFAGNMPEGSKVRLMKANFDKLIDASATAAHDSIINLVTKPDLALLISCVGRKLILNERTEEELEQAKEVFGAKTIMTGFYSYGEISPLQAAAKCELLNQTMTITTLTEIA